MQPVVKVRKLFISYNSFAGITCSSRLLYIKSPLTCFGHSAAGRCSFQALVQSFTATLCLPGACQPPAAGRHTTPPARSSHLSQLARPVLRKYSNVHFHFALSPLPNLPLCIPQQNNQRRYVLDAFHPPHVQTGSRFTTFSRSQPAHPGGPAPCPTKARLSGRRRTVAPHHHLEPKPPSPLKQKPIRRSEAHCRKSRSPPPGPLSVVPSFRRTPPPFGPRQPTAATVPRTPSARKCRGPRREDAKYAHRTLSRKRLAGAPPAYTLSWPDLLLAKKKSLGSLSDDAALGSLDYM